MGQGLSEGVRRNGDGGLGVTANPPNYKPTWTEVLLAQRKLLPAVRAGKIPSC